MVAALRGNCLPIFLCGGGTKIYCTVIWWHWEQFLLLLNIYLVLLQDELEFVSNSWLIDFFTSWLDLISWTLFMFFSYNMLVLIQLPVIINYSFRKACKLCILVFVIRNEDCYTCKFISPFSNSAMIFYIIFIQTITQSNIWHKGYTNSIRGAASSIWAAQRVGVW